MSSLSLRLPDSLHAKVRELADRDDVSINQFIATAVAEKAAALLTLAYVEERAKRGDRAAFDRILAALGIKQAYPTTESKAQACVSIIEAFISGYKLMDETNKARRELFEKASKVFEKLAEEWKIAGSVQLANTLGSAERS